MTNGSERLAEAKRLFLPDPSSKIIKQITENEKYLLRKRNMANIVSSTWHDDDDSEDYDPAQERKQLKRKRTASLDDESGRAEKNRSSSPRLESSTSEGEPVSVGFLDSLPLFQEEDGQELDMDIDTVVESSLEQVPDPTKGNDLQSPNGVKARVVVDNELRTMPTRSITTSFAHPVKFDHVPQPSDPCHWCADFTYGILGLGKRTVEMIDLGGGIYNEITGGHTQDGHKPSRMCVSCAQKRMNIIKCPGHQITPLAGLNPQSFDFKAAYDSFTPSSRRRIEKNAWCSLCPTPAFLRCGTIFGHGQSRVVATGCGLQLCETCAILMRAFRGDIAQVVAMNVAEDPEDGSHADVCYLLPGSELYTHYAGVKR
ncbi:hypothetical protein BDW59DRAFT_150450 [Aspergillus cavernicola]|uniref:C6 finger domain protein n=1 Tax=Aspergillus cavernicola TaxID=176166 RepID=A0ABR4HZS5_9EURO